MVLVHHFSLCNKPSLTITQISLITSNKFMPLMPLWFSSKTLNSCSSTVGAGGKESQQYEIDQEKAKEALKKLDQQLQDLSKKQVTMPKLKASEVKITRDRTTEEEEEEEEEGEYSGSFIGLITAGLFLFTIFYNILYVTVIDPPTK